MQREIRRWPLSAEVEVYGKLQKRRGWLECRERREGNRAGVGQRGRWIWESDHPARMLEDGVSVLVGDGGCN